MREILFRGKRLDKGEWIEGFYVHLRDDKGNESHRIYIGYAETDCGDFYPDWLEVDPTTIGQYTGLTDKNGVRIFEGDVVKLLSEYAAPHHPHGVVKYDVGSTQFLAQFDSEEDIENVGAWSDSCIVIGNIHDNPELLSAPGGGNYE